MPLTANLIPSQITTFPVPFDAQLAFASAQTITSTGYVNNLNSGLLDVGGGAPSSAAGRFDGIWNILVSAANMGTSDETYTFRLLGSNDSGQVNGTLELLQMYDFAATAALRNLATILGASPTIPPTGLGGTLIQRPFTNLVGRIYYRWLKCHLVSAGTGQSVTVTSWVSRAGIDV